MNKCLNGKINKDSYNNYCIYGVQERNNRNILDYITISVIDPVSKIEVPEGTVIANTDMLVVEIMKWLSQNEYGAKDDWRPYISVAILHSVTKLYYRYKNIIVRSAALFKSLKKDKQKKVLSKHWRKLGWYEFIKDQPLSEHGLFFT